MTTLTFGQYAPLLFRSSAAPHSTMPRSVIGVFLRRDLRHRADYCANLTFERDWLRQPLNSTLGVIIRAMSPTIFREGTLASHRTAGLMHGWIDSNKRRQRLGMIESLHIPDKGQHSEDGRLAKLTKTKLDLSFTNFSCVAFSLR